MMTNIRRMLRPVKLIVKCLIGYINSKDFIRNSEKVCWVIGTPDHKNLGDHAIAYATIKYVEKNLPGYQIIEITEDNFYNEFFRMKKLLKSNDIILLQGGGNFGNLYIYTEYIRRTVLFYCRKNPIIMMPQTICFTNDDEGKREQEITEKLYKKNKNIFYFAREKISADIMSKILGEEKVACVPDIVLTLHDIKETNAKDRNGVLCCLRDDKEALLSEHERNHIVESARKYGEVFHTDTISNNVVPWKERNIHLDNKWEDFFSAEVVITDRLHGLIFAVITNTPCIVFANNNHKIQGVYDWIKSFSSVLYIKSSDDLTVDVISKLAKDPVQNDWNIIDSEYEPLQLKLQEVTKIG